MVFAHACHATIFYILPVIFVGCSFKEDAQTYDCPLIVPSYGRIFNNPHSSIKDFLDLVLLNVLSWCKCRQSFKNYSLVLWFMIGNTSTKPLLVPIASFKSEISVFERKRKKKKQTCIFNSPHPFLLKEIVDEYMLVKFKVPSKSQFSQSMRLA